MLNSTTVEPAVRVCDLTVKRGRTEVLHAISCELAPGSITGLLGPSGCGKTTLMRTIVGAQHITSGSITVLGLPADSPELRRRRAYTSQAVSIYPDVTVGANVSYFGRLVGASKQNIAEVIDLVGLSEYTNRRVDQLSGGQASRASMACALVGEPEVLILDEPTVGLDPLTRTGLWQTFRSLAESGVTLLISSHVMDEAIRCDQVLFMRDGIFLAHEPVNQTMARTKTSTPDDAFLALVRQSLEQR